MTTVEVIKTSVVVVGGTVVVVGAGSDDVASVMIASVADNAIAMIVNDLFMLKVTP